ncbi:MAG TPA: DNA polymerase IV [Acidimicrobiales bacterium]|nr:DNA polymerase IV [Acidimicrobiales bacterium]
MTTADAAGVAGLAGIEVVGDPTILHVDMDAFFVSVELLERPDLRGRPVVVGGDGNRGVVAAASYEARSYGIHSAMPSTRARRLCPHATFLRGRHARYQEVSTEVFGIFRSITPLVEGISLDEAFLDVAGAHRLFGTAPAIAELLRRRVHDETGLWCSVGVAPRKLIAKLASEAAKPGASRAGPQPGRGVVVVGPAEELAFLHAHPVGALWGVGPATLARLERLAVRTVGDLAGLPESTLVAALGKGAGSHLHALAWARDSRAVVPDTRPKSVSHEETFSRDHHSLETLDREVVRLSEAVGTRLRRAGLAGRTVSVKVRFNDFRTITRSETHPEGIDTGVAIARTARRLLAEVDPSPGVRLLGVGITGLAGGATRQLSLEASDEPDWTDATRAVDAIRGRFGDAAIGPAVLAGRGGLEVKRQGDQQWGPGRDPAP